MRNTLLASLLLTAAVPAVMTAAPLSPEDALARALPSIRKTAPRISQAETWQLAYTSKVPGEEDTNGCYVFKSHTGYIVASADDRTRPLLGWSDDPDFDAETMSPEFKWWLGEYGREMRAALDDPKGGDETNMETPVGPIEPMVKTHWNQFAPYNDMCPLVHGHKVVTGCVATALAQVLKYHNWPEKGEGKHSYWLDGEEISFDYGTTTFDWEHMTDNYGRHSTAVERDAVAELMLACGVAVNMNYHPGGSGASTGALPWRLRNLFDYAPTSYNARRPYYGLIEWNDLIYNSLKDYGPVQYSGFYGDGEGHSFVCDGYLEKGYFHINWGWGGANDGFYLLTGLRPEHKGHSTTDGVGGFNFNQSAIVDVCRPDGQTHAAPIVIDCVDSFSIAQKWSQVGREITVRRGFWNDGADMLDGELALRAVAENGDTLYLPGREVKDYRGGEMINAYRARLTDDLKEGVYTLAPVFRPEGSQEWHTFNFAPGASSEEQMKVYMHEGKLHVHMLGTQSGGTVSVVDLQTEGKLAPNRNFHISFEAENTTDEEWKGALRVAAFTTDGKLIADSEPFMVDLPARTNEAFAFDTKLSHIVNHDLLTDGKIMLCITHANTHPVSESIPAEFEMTGQGSGVRQPMAANGNEELNGEVTVWSLTGAKVASGNWESLHKGLHQGVYILTDSEGHTAKRMVK